MQRHAWSRLTKQQVGAYAEYFVKMELTMFGFQVYTTEVDDRGIDFVARHGSGPFLEIQVKSVRDFNYVFVQKRKFALSETLYLALGLLFEGKAPDLYLIPSCTWKAPTDPFVSRDYGKEGQVSVPEWGLSLTSKNLPALEAYRLETTVDRLLQASGYTHDTAG
jgi:hypothetical protein